MEIIVKIAINYADKLYAKAQKLNTKTAYKKGGIDRVIEYGPKDIDSKFAETFGHILKQEKGGGYWLWKPYIINKTIDLVKDGDYIIYTDSGSYYVDNIDKLIACMNRDNIWLMSFSLPLFEIQYTKRDVFEAFNMWNSKHVYERQRLATFILFRKCKESKIFFDEYLEYATMDELITDAKSKIQPESDSFIENRHDQSIYSLLCKKWNIPEYRDPSEYGIYPELYHLYDDTCIDYDFITKCDYPQIMVSHRKRSPIYAVRFDAWLRRKIPFEIYKNIKRIEDVIIMYYKRTNHG